MSAGWAVIGDRAWPAPCGNLFIRLLLSLLKQIRPQWSLTRLGTQTYTAGQPFSALCAPLLGPTLRAICSAFSRGRYSVCVRRALKRVANMKPRLSCAYCAHCCGDLATAQTNKHIDGFLFAHFFLLTRSTCPPQRSLAASGRHTW